MSIFNTIRLRLVLLSCLAGAWSMSGVVRAEEVTVLAAASLSDVLRELEQPFAKATGHRVRWSFGGSGLLARQLQEGVPADVFISADEVRMDQVAQLGLVDPETRVALAGNQLVLITPKAAEVVIHTVDDLAGVDVHRVALGNPSLVPAGAYGQTWLENIGLWPNVAGKIVPFENVRAVLAAVASGNVETGVVYRTDALRSSDVIIVLEVPAEEAPRIIYPAALVRKANAPAAARRLLAFLTEGGAQAVFSRHGFQPATP